MAKRVHIVVSDPSPIISSGVVSLLQKSPQITADIAQIQDLSMIRTGGYTASIDLLIVNPSQMGLVTPAQLRADLGVEALKVVALQSSFTDQSTLSNFDAHISIYDSVESIIERVAQVCKNSYKEEDQRCELSQREREIIVCVVKGMTNKQIADTLFLSTHTVISHRRNIASKLQIHSPAGLTIYAIVNKLVDLAEIKSSINV